MQRCAKINTARNLHRSARLTAVFIDHCGQKIFGDKSPPKASLARVNTATDKPVAKGRLRSYTPLLHTREGGMGVQSLPHEQTSDHDDARLSAMEKHTTLHPEPLDADRLLSVYRISTDEFPPPIGEPTPRHPSIPRGRRSCGTIPFHYAPQPISSPGAVDHLVPPSPRTLAGELLGISTRVEVSWYHKRSQYHG